MILSSTGSPDTITNDTVNSSLMEDFSRGSFQRPASRALPSAAQRKPAKEVPKATRTRTGCRTCRTRHLKCDEGRPYCNQCIKSKQACTYEKELKWGKLNDKNPQPVLHFVPIENAITIEDESLLVASEYQGGTAWYARYAALEAKEQPKSQMSFDATISSISNYYGEATAHSTGDFVGQRINQVAQDYNAAQELQPLQANAQYLSNAFSSDSDFRENSISDPLEAYFMQVFVEEVGPWMDIMNHTKYVSQTLPTGFWSLDYLLYTSSLMSCLESH